jgi:hypothetical protein
VRVAFPSGTRSNAFDRNPSSVLVGGGASATAGQDNQVVTYTVPASRRADLAVQTSLVVTTALVAAQVGRSEVLGTGNVVIHLAELEPAAAVGTRADSPSIHVQLKAGETVQIRVTAGAGAGQVIVNGGIQGVEYDA